MKLEKTIHVAFDELRMQTLGVQVLFGFQFQSVFQERFASASDTANVASFFGLACIVGTLGLLLAAPCQHRLVERGLPSHRILRVASPPRLYNRGRKGPPAGLNRSPPASAAMKSNADTRIA